MSTFSKFLIEAQASIALFAAVAALLTTLRALRKESKLRAIFEWASVASFRETDPMIKSCLDHLRQRNFEEMQAAGECPLIWPLRRLSVASIVLTLIYLSPGSSIPLVEPKDVLIVLGMVTAIVGYSLYPMLGRLRDQKLARLRFRLTINDIRESDHAGTIPQFKRRLWFRAMLHATSFSCFTVGATFSAGFYVNAEPQYIAGANAGAGVGGVLMLLAVFPFLFSDDEGNLEATWKIILKNEEKRRNRTVERKLQADP